MAIILLAFAMQLAPIVAAEPRAPLVMPRPVLPVCAGGEGAEVVVCGDRAARYRLPLPHERADDAHHVIGEAPSALAAITPAGRCGIFAGERRCGKAAAAAYGYGGGRDPVTFFSKLGRGIVSPDSEP